MLEHELRENYWPKANLKQIIVSKAKNRAQCIHSCMKDGTQLVLIKIPTVGRVQ